MYKTPFPCFYELLLVSQCRPSIFNLFRFSFVFVPASLQPGGILISSSRVRSHKFSKREEIEMANAQWSRELRDDWRRLQQKFEEFGPSFKVPVLLPVLLVVVVLLGLWSSWYTVQPEETAVVQRFGRVQRSTGPGLHFKIPFGIETVKR